MPMYTNSSNVGNNATPTIITATVISISAGLTLYFGQRILSRFQYYQRLTTLSSNKPTRETLLMSNWLPRDSMLVLNQVVDAFIPEECEDDLEEDGMFLIDRAFESLWPSLMDHEVIFEALSPFMEKQNIRSFLLSGSKELGVAVVAAEAMEKLLLKEDRDQIAFLLKLLSTSIGTFAMTGYPISFHRMPLEERTRVLRCLRDSYIPQFRAAYQALRRLTGSIFASYGFQNSQESPSGKSNAAWDAMGYSVNNTVNKPKMVTLDDNHEKKSKRAAAAAAAPTPRKVPFPEPANCSKLKDSEECDIYEADVVVVGSGAGGGTIAAQLVKEGYKVIIVEKGEYYRSADFATWTEAEAFESMYERGGFCTTKDGNIVVLAGATVGGGTTINWSASFKTPDYVRREWAKSGLTCFEDGGEFESALNETFEMFNVNNEYAHSYDNDIEDTAPCDGNINHEEEDVISSSEFYRMKNCIGHDDGDIAIGYHLSHDFQSQDVYDDNSRLLSSTLSGTKGAKGSVNTTFTKNINNEILIKGAYSQDKYPEVIARNAVGCVDCGACAHGCPYNAKQSTVHSQLEPLASSGNLFLIPNCHVDKIVIDDVSKEAKGIQGTIYMNDDRDGNKKMRKMKINASVVISSCGSLHTPTLFLRSGLKNQHIGRHLALHPVAGVAGLFDIDTLQSLYGHRHRHATPGADLCCTGLGKGISMGIVVRSDMNEQERTEKHRIDTSSSSSNSSSSSSSSRSSSNMKKEKVKYGKDLATDVSREMSHGIFTTTSAIETPPIHPGILGMVMSWDTGLALKSSFLWYRQLGAFIGIPRDLSSYHNRITLSSEGQPLINYTLTTHDEQVVLNGIELMMKMMRGAGASVQFPIHESRPWIDMKKLDDETFQQVIDDIRMEGVQKHRMQLFSAHQMRL